MLKKRPGVFHRCHTQNHHSECQCKNSSDDDVLRFRPNNEIRALLILYKSFISLSLCLAVFFFF